MKRAISLIYKTSNQTIAQCEVTSRKCILKYPIVKYDMDM